MILPSVQWTVQFLSSQGNIKIEFSEAYYSLKNINKKMIPFPTTNSHIFFFFLTKSLFLDKKKNQKKKNWSIKFFKLYILSIFQ